MVNDQKKELFPSPFIKSIANLQNGEKIYGMKVLYHFIGEINQNNVKSGYRKVRKFE